MKSILGSVASLLLGAVIVSAATGCKVACKDNEEDNGGECTAKSVKRFTGQESTATPVTYTSGANLKVDGVYGNVNVKQGEAGKVGLKYIPFDWEGYDESDLAVRQMEQNLHVSLGGTSEITVTSTRDDVSNGLGANLDIFLPPEFDGSIDIDNHGKGPLAGNADEFDTFVDYVGAATSVNVHGGASLGDCKVKGAATVKNTVMDCGELVDARGISDNFTLTSRNGSGLEDVSAAVELVSISPEATGGEVNAAGVINAWFPASAVFSVQAFNADPDALVDPGTIPSNCNLQETAPASKTITCGTGGPNYKLTSTGDTDSVFNDGNIYMELR